jgi:hypothetical protein
LKARQPAARKLVSRRLPLVAAPVLGSLRVREVRALELAQA